MILHMKAVELHLNISFKGESYETLQSKNISLANIAAIIFLNNLFLFTLANQYPGLDKVISPQITLRVNKYKNREGITLNPHSPYI